ncbi:helix-turn-helix domain-containing protein [Halobacillus litoralis]|uniref:helix-turn-helix domain-containing protein n=1 Tax=Halobacillus litoralis TaxID=45668 RepID=UPI002490DB66|nr:helix-turn-helix transcriptional regulator [Halobacillus litoralis]
MFTKEPCKGFGGEIRKWREESQISQEEFAWLLATDVASVERLEKEELYPSSYMISLIADGLNMDVQKVEDRIWCDTPDQCEHLNWRDG